MFGGLDMKGSGSKDEQDPPAVAPATSGFGFLNTTTATEEAPPAEPASSSFSFMNSTSAEPAPESVAASGFSFLSAAEAPEPEAEPTTTEASSGFSFMTSPAAEAPAPAPAEPTAEASSGFSFLTSPAAEAPAPAPVESSSSGFDFLMQNVGSSSAPAVETTTTTTSADAEREPSIPSTESIANTVPSMSVSSTASASTTTTTPSLMETTPPVISTNTASSLPTGAGVTFGTAAKRGGVKKKKNRAARVGMGAPPPVAPAPVAQSSAPSPAPVAGPTGPSARDDAEAAARRAEEFMTQKSVDQAKSAPVEVPAYGSIERSPPVDSPGIETAPSTDSVVYKAQKAAEEAKALSKQQQQQQSQKSSGFMGTFFKGFGANSKGQPPSSAPPSSTNNTVDRLAKQQKDMKRAMAEREMKLHHQQQQNDDEDDDVVVSTSVGTYSPDPVPLPVSAAVTKSNPISSHFQPAKAPTVVKEKAPQPKKKKTAQEVFEEYQALFAQSVHKAMEQVENVRSTQKMLLEERFVAMAKENLSTQQIAQTEAQLQVAVEEEDYELADQLGQVADAHKREKSEVAMMLDANIKALEHLDSQKSLVIKGVATCFQNLAVRLTELQKKEEANDNNDSETFKQFEIISKQLSAEQERLQQDAKHLERDEQLVGEERKELEGAISEQSGAIEEQRDEVKEKLDEVEKEIEELRKKLEEKQKVAAGLRTEMHGYEDSISKVRTKFSRQLNRVDKKETAIQENRNEWETEQKAHQQQKEAHELQVQTHSEAMLAHDELMKTLESELKLTEVFAEMIPSKLGFLEDATKDESKEDSEEGDLAQLQADVVKCEAAVSEAKIVLKAASAVISNLESEHATLLTRIPALEAEKKAAASSRDFKAAGKASKEIKDATARLKECEEELVGEAAKRKQAAEEEVQRLDAELTKTRTVADEKEKISNQSKMAILAKKIEQLQETRAELCGDATSSENCVRGVGALVLEGQIKSLKMEGENLGNKYGGWNELIGESPSSDEKNVEAVEESEGKVEKEASTSSPEEDCGLSRTERIAKVRALMNRIQEAEKALEVAAAKEDFDEAAELHEVFQNLQSELESINLSEEDMEIALSNEELEDVNEEEQPTEEVTTTEEEEEGTSEDAAATSEEQTQAVEESDQARDEEDGSENIENADSDLPSNEDENGDLVEKVQQETLDSDPTEKKEDEPSEYNPEEILNV